MMDALPTIRDASIAVIFGASFTIMAAGTCTGSREDVIIEVSQEFHLARYGDAGDRVTVEMQG